MLSVSHEDASMDTFRGLTDLLYGTYEGELQRSLPDLNCEQREFVLR